VDSWEELTFLLPPVEELVDGTGSSSSLPEDSPLSLLADG